jgi:hypothetical protein
MKTFEEWISKTTDVFFDRLDHLATYDKCKATWNSCAQEYEKELTMLKSQLEVAVRALEDYVPYYCHSPFNYQSIAKEALAKIEAMKGDV